MIAKKIYKNENEKGMMSLMENIDQIKEVLGNIKIDKRIHENNKKHQNLAKIIANRQLIYDEIISLISNKNMHLLGPEKSITAKFIAENPKEIINILNDCLNNKNFP